MRCVQALEAANISNENTRRRIGVSTDVFRNMNDGDTEETEHYTGPRRFELGDGPTRGLTSTESASSGKPGIVPKDHSSGDKWSISTESVMGLSDAEVDRIEQAIIARKRAKRVVEPWKAMLKKGRVAPAPSTL